MYLYKCKKNFHSHDLTRTCFPGMYWVLPGECFRPKGGIIQSMINRWSDYIGQDRDSRHFVTMSTTLQHFTHIEIQWPTAARRCHFGLWDVSCRQSWHLLTPSHPQVPPEWPVWMVVHCIVKHSRPPDLKSSLNVSLPFAWITRPATDPKCNLGNLNMISDMGCY